jgi:hypothetical protein
MENFQKYLSTAPVLLTIWLTFTAGDDIHLDRCWSTNSPPFGWVNTLFHRKAECWSS